MSYIFTKDCAGDLGILVLDDDDQSEYMAAICFYRASGGYPVFDIAAGGQPIILASLPEALNHMIAIAQALIERAYPDDLELLHPDMTAEHLGLIPLMLSEDDMRSAKDQIHAHYAHGGGWRSKSGFKFNSGTYTLKYAGDPIMRPLAKAQLRSETILFYQYSWIVIMQSDGAYDVARID